MKDNKIYFAVKALILHENNFLIMHKTRKEENVWELPGGRMEFGETAEETLNREVQEETGLSVTPMRILDTWNIINDKYQITGIIYLCKTKNNKVRLSEEHDKYKWVRLDISFN
ncbi:putative 8-oxo-dGTP diphosphatase YtkD [Oxobacter pfennigii]|uniref:Putative 8-oxo-dGTP diphosphatase YtkD n=1 Tax=Oxobacter pfennigii TaxID=36849 RepID=A0A0P8YFJ3_9CLOT|nr:NUDIX domain-containing protein [Oxobacter pfennigii]KPU45858.1 putative 8-oxo-dGTP diphosphatase YtkD [Oxobacter pfennigii]